MNFSHSRTLAQSAREYCRGITGGLLFAIPLLYTSEVWKAGAILHPIRILLGVAATFGILLLYNRFAGLREDASMREVAIDSVEEMGLGIVISAAVLWMTGQINDTMGLPEITGKVVLEAMTVAIGVSVGTAQLGGQCDGDEGVAGGSGSEGGYSGQTAISFCGAVLFAANIAPTAEVQRIAAESHPFRIILLACGSIVATAVVLHYADLRGSQQIAKDSGDSIFRKVRAVITTYAAALTASAACLFLFGNLDGEPWPIKWAMIVITGVPAALGASAGRFILEGRSSNNQ